jgi:signal transduction histidine kinase
MAMVAAGASFSFPAAVGYLVAVPVAWLFLAISDFGANHSLLDASQEAIQLFLFPTTLVAMVLALRWEAGKVDKANQIAIDSAVESARIDAVELERTRLDALVHDSVLTTLLVAAASETEEQRQVAQKSAELAIEKLRRAAIGVESRQEMTVASLFSALTTAINDSYPGTLVSSERANDQVLPTRVVKALTEATLQALDNSVKHSPLATNREVRLRGINGGLKIVVSDNGKGFRVNQVPKDRLGLRNSIIGRVEGVGGKVFLNTRPGAGTTLVFEWAVS